MDEILTDESIQQLYISSMISSPEIFAQVSPLLKSNYFDSKFQRAIQYIQEYFNEYRSVPNIEVFKAVTHLPTVTLEVQRSDIQYISEQIAKFCQVKAMIQAVRQSPKLIENQDYGGLVQLIKEAAEIKLVQNTGIEYFTNIRERLEKRETTQKRISTGWKDVDELLDGGVARQELINILAPSGGGKSVTMLNLARNLLAQGLNGVYISLEMAGEVVAQRTDTMISRIASGKILSNLAQVEHEIEKFGRESNARFFVHRLREGTTTANDILAYLRVLETSHGFRPDFIVVDYLDIMASVQKGAEGNMFLKDQFVSQEVRAIGFDYNAIMISASQLGKHATDAINDGRAMHQGDVQGGSSKTNTSDIMIAAVRTEAMLEANEFRFDFVKSRNSGAAGKRVMMSFDPISLRILDHNSLNLKKKDRPALSIPGVRPGQKTSLQNLTNVLKPDT